MEASDFYNLTEAYYNVYQELDEAKWGEQDPPFRRMISKSDDLSSSTDPRKQHRGAMIHLAARNPKGPKVKVRTGPKFSEMTPSQRRNFNQQNEEHLINIIISHLIDEGYANSFESAEVILDNMSEDWMYGILNEIGPKGDMRYRQTTYKGTHGQSKQEYQDSRSDAGKRISGTSKTGPRGYVARGVRDEPVAPGERPNPYPLSQSEREYNQYERSANRRLAPYRRVGGPKGLPG